jgi:energy-coupling factor transporter ATP-binding protein EcfA2
MVTTNSTKQSTRPETISRFKKERFLLNMSEDQFRDEVVRPLFFRQGLIDGRDLCGPFERGKDAAFVAVDNLGIEDLYVLQTKKGALNLARKAQSNIVEAITQLKTALETRVVFIKTKQKKYPAKAILCASGKINDSARTYIVGEVKDPRVVFLDSDDLIPKIDEIFPELWLGIDAEVGPYFRKLKQLIEDANESLSVGDFLPTEERLGAATDNVYVPLHLYRTILKPKKEHGQIKQEPEFQQIPVTTILNRREQLFLLLGEAGSGKSTAVKHLAYLLVTKGLKFDQQDLKIPVLLRAVDISKASSSLVAICSDETKRITNSNNPSFSNNDLVSGRVAVFIDALDELSDDVAREGVLTAVDEFHANYPKCQIVITSRNYSFTKTLAQLQAFETYRISPINYQQAERIINTLQKAKKNLAAEKSREILRRLQNVHGIELNPLLVTVFAAISDYARQDIPANITELFKKYTEMMLGRWDSSKGLAQQYHAPLKDFVLTRVAFEMHRRRATSISVDEFEEIIENELKSRGHEANMAELLEEMVHRSGLFRIVGDSIEFRHFLLQEFFAGRGIPSVDFLEAVVGEEWWQRSIVFYFGENPSEGTSLETVKTSLTLRPLEETYQAATTVGLALQACYLIEITQKMRIYRWVVEALARARHSFVEGASEFEKYPLRMFIGYYLLAKDSVALSILESNVGEVLKSWQAERVDDAEEDLRMFWLIVGLLEAGSVKKAEELIKRFHPGDARLLLGIHLGCFLIQHLHTAGKEQQKFAKRITDKLDDKIQHLRAEVLKEWKSELLEIRKGEIREIDVQKALPSAP